MKKVFLGLGITGVMSGLGNQPGDCRSAVARGKIKLPLGPGEPELLALARALPD